MKKSAGEVSVGERKDTEAEVCGMAGRMLPQPDLQTCEQGCNDPSDECDILGLEACGSKTGMFRAIQERLYYHILIKCCSLNICTTATGQMKKSVAPACV